jgi:hypothetical protein
MDFYGIIRARDGGPPLTYEAWCEFVARRKDLVRATPRTGRNPKTGEPLVIRPRPDGATIVVNGEKLGSVGWSLSGADEVVVSGNRDLWFHGPMLSPQSSMPTLWTCQPNEKWRGGTSTHLFGGRVLFTLLWR